MWSVTLIFSDFCLFFRTFVGLFFLVEGCTLINWRLNKTSLLLSALLSHPIDSRKLKISLVYLLLFIPYLKFDNILLYIFKIFSQVFTFLFFLGLVVTLFTSRILFFDLNLRLSIYTIYRSTFGTKVLRFS